MQCLIKLWLQPKPAGCETHEVCACRQWRWITEVSQTQTIGPSGRPHCTDSAPARHSPCVFSQRFWGKACLHRRRGWPCPLSPDGARNLREASLTLVPKEETVVFAAWRRILAESTLLFKKESTAFRASIPAGSMCPSDFTLCDSRGFFPIILSLRLWFILPTGSTSWAL